MVLAIQAKSEIVIDSGADISVAPLHMANLGSPARRSGILMQDAQGKRVPEVESRVLDVELETLEGSQLLLREKFCLAPVASIIISMGRLLRWGWSLATCHGKPVIERGGHQFLRRNTLTILATVASIAASPLPGPGAAEPPGTTAERAPRQVNMMTFTTWLGRLPPEAESLAGNPGWHILPSGLPFFVAHRVEEINVEQSLWNDGDWAWLAIFVRVETATRLPEVGDVWVQVLTVTVEAVEDTPKILVELDSELDGRRDIAMVLHVEELAKDLLSNPVSVFSEPADDSSSVPVPMADDSGGVGELPGEMAVEERMVGNGSEDEKEEELEGVKLSVETPLKDLKEACRKLGLPVSGGKNKVLRRLRVHHEVLEKQMASEVARKLFAEQEREPGVLKTPVLPSSRQVLPSSRQQELHNVTHHPFQPWCEACVLGRSRQNPHRTQHDEPQGDELPNTKDGNPVIQLDYGYSFTRLRGELAEDEANAADDQGQAPNPAGAAAGQETNQEDNNDGKEAVDVRSVWAVPFSSRVNLGMDRRSARLGERSQLT